MSKPEQGLTVAPRLDAQALLFKAIEKDVDVTTVERLVELAKDVREVTAREAFYAAMVQFQKRCPPIHKTARAGEPGRFGYRYAELSEILDAITPLMAELGLFKTWEQWSDERYVYTICIVSHEKGHSVRPKEPLRLPHGSDRNRMNGAQQVGSGATYGKRYTLLAALGIAPDEDDDAQGTTDRPARGPDHSREPRAPVAGPQGSDRERSLRVGGSETETVSVDDPALQRESRELFPDPQEDVERESLLNEWGFIATKQKWGSAVRSGMWSHYVGPGMNPSQADVAALKDLVNAAKAKAAKE